MYLSRVELDPTRRSTMAALAAPQKLHGAVESSFTGERRRRLWRLDRLGEQLYLLLLSEDVPVSFDPHHRQYGYRSARELWLTMSDGPESTGHDPFREL